MNNFTTILAAAALLMIVNEKAAYTQSNWNPYGQSPPSSLYQVNPYGDEDDSGQPNTYNENRFTQESNEQRQQMRERDLNMMRTDRRMIRGTYDPNQTFYYGEYPSSNAASSTSGTPVNPPKNQGGAYQSEMNQAETLMQGYKTSPNGTQVLQGAISNPYSDGHKAQQK